MPVQIVQKRAELKQYHADPSVPERIRRYHPAGRYRHKHVEKRDHVRRYQIALGKSGHIVHDRSDRCEQIVFTQATSSYRTMCRLSCSGIEDEGASTGDVTVLA
uniref:Uncharacterized protein n=1 Tax=Anopheles culicifacies TaxID=139723 RepID=A0A182M8P5_9DIPT